MRPKNGKLSCLESILQAMGWNRDKKRDDERQVAKTDGEGQIVKIDLSYLGAIKQIPQLMREITTLMPNITIAFWDLNNGKETLLDELKRTNPAILERIDLRDQSECTKPIIRIGLEINSLNKYGFKYDKDGYVYKGDRHESCHGFLQFTIDPLKFEARPQLTEDEQQQLKAKYRLTNERVVIGGSLRQEEHQPFFEAIQYANIANPKIKTIGLVVPRYEVDLVVMETNALKIPVVSDKNQNISNRPEGTDIIIITKKGILQDLYSICDVAVIGDTLWIEPGMGQNPLEPAFYGKRIIAGPRKGKWNDIAYKGLAKSGLLTHITNQEELNTEVAREINEQQMQIWKANAHAFIQSQQGAAKRYARYVQQAIYEPKKLLTLQNSK